MSNGAMNGNALLAWRDRERFPLLLRFELHNEAFGEGMTHVAGFRNWDHYRAYQIQMRERNDIIIINEVVIDEGMT